MKEEKDLGATPQRSKEAGSIAADAAPHVASVRASFVEQFGEEQALMIEAAAEGHKNGLHDNPGSDYFKWAIVICIGFECFTKDSYRKYHKITAPVDEVKQWIKDHGDLASHDGDSDFLSAFCGAYNEYMPEKSESRS